MKYIITEQQYVRIIEQEDSIFKNLGGMGTLAYDLTKKIANFANEIRPKIEDLGKKFFPANDMVKKDPKFKTTPQYRELKDQEDAYCHQLASAMATAIFGPISANIIGKANEIKGGLRMFFKGSAAKGIGKYEKFTSGWEEDDANNQVGIELATKFPKKDLNFYSQQVLQNIKTKNYFDSTGNKKS